MQPYDLTNGVRAANPNPAQSELVAMPRFAYVCLLLIFVLQSEAYNPSSKGSVAFPHSPRGKPSPYSDHNTVCRTKDAQSQQQFQAYIPLAPNRNTRWVRMAQSDDVTERKAKSVDVSPRTLLVLLAYVALIAAAFFLAPASTVEVEVADRSLLQVLLSAPLSESVTPLFSTVWNVLGILPLLYTALLLPGSRNQRLFAPPFMGLSFILGFFALGPYLAFRAPREQVKQEEIGLVARFFETPFFRIVACAAVIATLYLLYHGFTSPVAGGLDRFTAYSNLFHSSRLVALSSMDLLALSAFVVDPLLEDMRRRNWFAPASTRSDYLKLLLAFPVLGPALYLCIRPSLPRAD